MVDGGKVKRMLLHGMTSIVPRGCGGGPRLVGTVADVDRPEVEMVERFADQLSVLFTEPALKIMVRHSNPKRLPVLAKTIGGAQPSLIALRVYPGLQVFQDFFPGVHGPKRVFLPCEDFVSRCPSDAISYGFGEIELPFQMIERGL